MSKRMVVDVRNHVLPLGRVGDAVQAGTVDLTSQPPVAKWRGVSYASPGDFVNVEKHMWVCREAGLTMSCRTCR